jgi:ferredoxin
MPTVRFRGRVLTCSPNAVLRDVLLAAKLTPHNGGSRVVHCPGVGSCGTCAVSIKGEVGPLTAMERWRLAFPPHRLDSGLRLACQVRVTSDLEVTKHGGFWGQDVGAPSEGEVA